MSGTGATMSHQGSNYWFEDGDVLVHDNRTRIGWLAAFVAIVSIPLFFVSGWIGVVGGLMLWFLVGIQALADVDRVEFDRRSRTMRQRSALGLKWPNPPNPFDSVRACAARV